MKHFYSIMGLMLLAALPAQARQLTPGEARDAARAYISKGMVKAPPVAGASGMRLVSTLRTAAAEPALYLFTGADGKGLIVAPAESGCVPVLGYADCGAESVAELPPALRYWLDTYAAEIEMMRSGRTVRVPVRAAAEKKAIAPIVKTLWNQNAPYNDLCPQQGDNHAVTGCVATAMAQAMNVHQWPDQGAGTGTATFNGQTLSLNLAQSTYDWSSMLDEYGSDAAAAQRKAVATLMRDCGYSVKMTYSLQSSGASSALIPRALVENFNYDQATHNLERNYYQLLDWEDIVYGELAAGRPVIYSGASNQGGHCFVCDGYSSDRYFHINWGWGGMSDGYFRLSALNPEIQGIGGSTGGFNLQQSITVGMTRPQADSQPYIQILCNGAFVTTTESCTRAGTVGFSSPAFLNRSIVSVNGTLGVKLTAGHGEPIYVAGTSRVSLQLNYFTTSYSVAASGFPDEGTYTVTPAILCSDGKWVDIPVRIDSQQSVTVECGSDMLKFTADPVQSNIEVSDVKLVSPMYSDAPFRVTATVANNGTAEYLGFVGGVLIDGQYNVIAQADVASIDLLGGESMSLDYVSKFTEKPADGYYYFLFANRAGKIVSEPIEVKITSAPSEAAELSADMRVTSGNEAAEPTVPYDNIVLEGVLSCKSGYYAGSVNAFIFPAAGGAALANIGSVDCFLGAGESQSFKMKAAFTGGQIGQTYAIVLFAGGKQVEGAAFFVLGDSDTGVSEVYVPKIVTAKVQGDKLLIEGCEGQSAVTVYTLDGSKALGGNGSVIDVTDLAPGYYIAVIGTTEGNAIVKFLR